MPPRPARQRLPRRVRVADDGEPGRLAATSETSRGIADGVPERSKRAFGDWEDPLRGEERRGSGRARSRWPGVRADAVERARGQVASEPRYRRQRRDVADVERTEEMDVEAALRRRCEPALAVRRRCRSRVQVGAEEQRVLRAAVGRDVAHVHVRQLATGVLMRRRMRCRA